MSGHIEIVAELIRWIGRSDNESTRNAIQNRTVCVEGLNNLSYRCGFAIEVGRNRGILIYGNLLGGIGQSVAPRQEGVTWIGLGLNGEGLIESKRVLSVGGKSVSPLGMFWVRVRL